MCFRCASLARTWALGFHSLSHPVPYQMGKESGSVSPFHLFFQDVMSMELRETLGRLKEAETYYETDQPLVQGISLVAFWLMCTLCFDRGENAWFSVACSDLDKFVMSDGSIILIFGLNRNLYQFCGRYSAILSASNRGGLYLLSSLQSSMLTFAVWGHRAKERNPSSF